MARSIKQSSDGYHIEIWDPNYSEGLGELVISSNFSSARFTNDTYGASMYNTNTVIKYIMPLSTKSQTYDAKNLQSVFGKTGDISAQASNSGMYLLYSDAGDFTVTAADGRSAEVKDGKQVSGNLKLLDGTIDGGFSTGYQFYIDASDLGEVTLSLDGEKAEVRFVSDDILAEVSADALSSVVIGDNKISTICASACQQKITMVSEALGSVWNKAVITGSDVSFTLDAEQGQLNVSAKNSALVTVQGQNVDSRESSIQQSVTASASGTTVTMSDLESGTQKGNPFTDVKANAYYYEAVLWAVQNGVTSGTSATTFSPDASCSRAQIVTFLWRANGSPKPANTNNPFKDVKAGAYYYDAVLWAVEKGITTGTGSDTFSPDVVCTRNQVVTFLWRSAGSPEPASSTNPFKDVPAGEYYTKAVLWAVEKGVTTGTGADTFSPGATCTRGQTVTFLFRSQGK